MAANPDMPLMEAETFSEATTRSKPLQEFQEMRRDKVFIDVHIQV